jgi:multiple sugar transport system substrate-binding protein
VRKAVSRRSLALVGGATVLALVAAGCGGSSDNNSSSTAGKGKGPVPEPTEPVTVTFSSWVNTNPGMAKLKENFERDHPNITIEFQNVTADNSMQKITTQIAGGNPPDAAFIDAGNVQAFAPRRDRQPRRLHRPQRVDRPGRLRPGVQGVRDCRRQHVRPAVRG